MTKVKTNPKKVENNPLIHVHPEGKYGSDHWYGEVFQDDNKGKGFWFNVSNFLDPKVGSMKFVMLYKFISK